MGRPNQQVLDTSLDSNNNDVQENHSQSMNMNQQMLGNQMILEQMKLNQAKDECRHDIALWNSESSNIVDYNSIQYGQAMEQFIGFEEGGTTEFTTLVGVIAGAAALPFFGTIGAVVGFCAATLGSVASLGSATAKLARANMEIEKARKQASQEIQQYQINSTTDIKTAQDMDALMMVQEKIQDLPTVQRHQSDMVYRDLLLLFAQKGGYHISGSQWNVDNMSAFGDAPWYHSWDWGSPGWTNGQDIAEELNALGEGNPETLKTVDINR